MSFDALSERQPKLYVISMDQFKKAPKKLQPYTPGQLINRDNFTNFLILSFSISRGEPFVQFLFMDWLKLKFGFDYLKTFENFSKAGGYKILSINEKEKFEQEFLKVAKHKDPEVSRPDLSTRELRTGIAREIQSTIENVTEIYPELEGKDDVDLSKMNFSEFLAHAQDVLMSFKDKRKLKSQVRNDA
jgi:hypothetical protein